MRKIPTHISSSVPSPQLTVAGIFTPPVSGLPSLPVADGDDTPSAEVTALLLEGGQGDPEALRRVIPLVYAELRTLARRHRARWSDDAAPGTASLVHEAYDRLAALQDVQWQSRAQFFYLASRAMRSILIDHAKHRGRAKRGGGQRPQPLPDEHADAHMDTEELLALDDALARLSASNERLGKIVLCRVFGGLTIDECAEALDLSPASVKRGWTVARSWLFDALGGQPDEPR